MRATRLLATALLLALPVAEAAAQSMVRPPPQARPQAGPAPALPGLSARRIPAPIPGDAAAGLSPNAALFDAIARGDLAAARDAMARGASLEARNQLNLTPLDAAVDQGRHDIAFFLLSSRDLSRGPGPLEEPPPAIAAERPAAPPRASARRQAASAREAGAAASAPLAAQLWAGDGGSPRPEIGFLGFDAGRPQGVAAPAPSRRDGRG